MCIRDRQWTGGGGRGQPVGYQCRARGSSGLAEMCIRDRASRGQYARHRHPHRQPGFMAKGGPRNTPDRRLLRTGERSGDCPGQGRDRPGGHWLRAGLRRNACRPETVGASGQDPAHRIGRARAHRAHKMCIRDSHRSSPIRGRQAVWHRQRRIEVRHRGLPGSEVPLYGRDLKQR